MSVDFFDCRICDESVCECGEFVNCECGNKWCSDECAEEDGFKRESCKLGYDIDDNECDKECWDCDNMLDKSCNYCREEDFEDNTLLEFALDKFMNMTRDQLIQEYKKFKGGQI